ncbi:hypothetical protein YC2023_115289 [Brassica napus]
MQVTKIRGCILEYISEPIGNSQINGTICSKDDQLSYQNEVEHRFLTFRYFPRAGSLERTRGATTPGQARVPPEKLAMTFGLIVTMRSSLHLRLRVETADLDRGPSGATAPGPIDVRSFQGF